MQAAAAELGSRAHAREAVGRRLRRGERRIESAPVVGDAHRMAAVALEQRHRDLGRAGMRAHVVERLLRDAKEDRAHLGRRLRGQLVVEAEIDVRRRAARRGRSRARPRDPPARVPEDAARRRDAAAARSTAARPARPPSATRAARGRSSVRRSICRRMPIAAMTWIESSWMPSARRLRSCSPAATNVASSRCRSAGSGGCAAAVMAGRDGEGGAKERSCICAWNLPRASSGACGTCAAHEGRAARYERAVLHNQFSL